MSEPLQTRSKPSRLSLPRAPVIALDGGQAFGLSLDGELTPLSAPEARTLIQTALPLVCHGPQTAAFLGIAPFPCLDVLELFAFARPGETCAPSPRGLARALHLLEPASGEDACLSLRDAARHLLADLSATQDPQAAAIAAMMDLRLSPAAESGAPVVGGWPWAAAVLSALGRADTPPGRPEIRAALKIWDRLSALAAEAPPPPPGHHGVSGEEVDERLSRALNHRARETRESQQAYARAIAGAFAPEEAEGDLRLVVAEAGTGTGKTLGYLAPAAAWAEKNGAPVWISTYTRNLQRQLDAELDRIYPDPADKARKAVTRKGRENYLCLLNLEDATQMPGALGEPRAATALGLMLRWAAVTTEGDLGGRDFPGWMPGLIGRGRAASLADRRGECLYAACPHFDRCFVEKSVRRAKRAEIVVANHALVMGLAAGGASEDLPARYIFDEGHHLFDAADSAFSAALTGLEAAELRRWILGAEAQGRTRARGLSRRLEDMTAQDDSAKAMTERLMDAARGLPGPQWRERLTGNAPRGPAEQFIALCRAQVLARNAEDKTGYSLEAEVDPPLPALAEAAQKLSAALIDIEKPMIDLAAFLENRLSDEAEDLDTETRGRLRFLSASLRRRARGVTAWREMLARMHGAPMSDNAVDWLEITRADGSEIDSGLHRHLIDPMEAFAAALKPQARGVAVTSATLLCPSPEDPEGWDGALARAGAQGLDPGLSRTLKFSAASPFDHGQQARVLIVGDVDKNSPDEIAAAYRALFLASGGGALGLFTAVQRLKSVQSRLQAPLRKAGLPLYAQHEGTADVATLIELFREEEDACLLGTDAARDGIDVPGRALRLVVCDRVPWPRPTVLHKARRARFSRAWDDRIARFRLQQAYGRLIRKADDRGVFVLLDAATPSRLLSAFPAGIEPLRCGLKDATALVRNFLTPEAGLP